MFLRLVIVFAFMFGLTFAGAIAATTILGSISRTSVPSAPQQYLPETVKWKKEIEAELAATKQQRTK